MNDFNSYDFPKQRIPNSEKDEAWAAQCCDHIIARGLAMRDTNNVEEKYDILTGVFPDDYYRKVLNPYNSTNEKYTRFPATMRHYDLIKGIIRRYVSEYIKNPHDFLVGANNPEVVLARNAKLREELAMVVEQQIAVKIQESYQQFLAEGNNPEEFTPEKAIDVQAFIEKFNEDYIDDISAQGQEILNVIKDITEDALLYAKAYFDFVTFGECYTYTEVKGATLTKRTIPPRDAFPVNTDNFFREDDDMFSYRRKMSAQQIIDEFDEYLSDKERSFLEEYYIKSGPTGNASYAFSVYESYFPEVCGKFSKQDRSLFAKQSIMPRDNNSGLYDVWYTFWRGEVRQAIVTFINANTGLVDTRIENDDYKFSKDNGDIDIEYIYKPQVYEAVRIGSINDAIYPLKGRAIDFDRNGKLPVNGVNELLPGFGKFSIVEIVTPFNVFYNIISYHREMAIAKNKMSILMMAKSLLGKVPENVIYKMLSDGVLYYDDTDDAASLKAQQVRMLSASNSEYIVHLGNILRETEQAAKDQVDMTAQRYGDIANSAGAGTTQEAIVRGSMGTVVIEFIMDYMRERDYARDMDFTKFAWIDGLDTSYRDDDNNVKYMSLNVNQHNYANYIVKAKQSVREKEKLDQLKQFAFSAAQNGDMDMAVAAISGDNVAAITKLIKKFNERKANAEKELKLLDQQLAQMEQEFELKKIAAKGEEDRKTAELEGIIESEIQLIKADANMISFDNGVDTSDKEAGMRRLESARNRNEQEKNRTAREANYLDAFSKAEDRRVKEKDIEAKIQIAKQNKNRYDFKAKARAKK